MSVDKQREFTLTSLDEQREFTLRREFTMCRKVNSLSSQGNWHRYLSGLRPPACEVLATARMIW